MLRNQQFQSFKICRSKLRSIDSDLEIKELDDLKDFKPIGLPKIVVVDGDFRRCNATAYNQYLERIEQARPEGASGFVKGEYLLRTYDHFRADSRENFVPIQFYAAK